MSIYNAETGGQSFGQVRNAFIRVVNQADDAEIARYDLSEDASTETAMVFGELYRNGAEWKFRAVGPGLQRRPGRNRARLRGSRLTGATTVIRAPTRRGSDMGAITEEEVE